MNQRPTLPVIVTAAAALVGCSGGGGSGTPTAPGGSGNHAPTVNVNTSATHLTYGGVATITATAADADGDQLTFSYTATGGTVSASGPTATAATFTAARQWGPALVTVTASDGRGGSAAATSSMYVRNPNPPAFSLAKVMTARCTDQVPPWPDCSQVQVTTPEAIVLTGFSISGTYDSGCHAGWDYNDVAVGAGQSRVLEWPGHPDVCAMCTPCHNRDVWDWRVLLWGRRPEPDGGSFAWEDADWSP